MSRNTTSCLVPISTSSGLDLNAYLFLKQKTARREQKLQTLNKYIEKYSSGWKKRLELANLLYEKGEWSKAAVEYNQVIQSQPNLIEPRLKLGKILQLTNQQEEASLVYSQALQLAKKEATRKHLIGLIEYCKNNVQEAIAALKEAANLEPETVVHWMALGQIQMQEEYLVDALFSFRQILSLDDHNFMVLIYSYDILLGLGYLDEAETYLEKAREIAPQDIQTLKRVIDERYRKKLVLGSEGKETKKLITLLQKKAPKTPEINHLLARFYILRGEKKKGLTISQQLAAENPHNFYAKYYYSRCLFELKKYKQAAEVILETYKLSWEKNQHCNRSIYLALCQILPVAGKKELVKKIIPEMLKLFPNSWHLRTTARRIMVKYFQGQDLDITSLSLTQS